MPDTPPTEEQLRGKRLYRCYNQGLTLIWIGAVMLMWLLFSFTNINGIGLILSLFLPGSAASFVYIKRFARRLSHQDLYAISESIPSEDMTSWVHIEKVRRLYHAYEAVHGSLSEDSLLRPSSEPQDDTLLRAAAYTTHTPQDQLLRPASTGQAHLNFLTFASHQLREQPKNRERLNG